MTRPTDDELRRQDLGQALHFARQQNNLRAAELFDRYFEARIETSVQNALARRLSIAESVGWLCPNCKGAHPASVKTCPVDTRTLGDRLR